MSEMETEDVQKIFDFLTNVGLPKGISVGKSHQPKLSHNKAMTVIWFMQEVMNIIPSNFEMCIECRQIYDSNSEGHWDDKKGGYCNSCLRFAPKRVKKEAGFI